MGSTEKTEEQRGNASITPGEPVALVTGAGRGLGQALAVELGRGGGRVALVARSRPELELTAARVREAGGRALVIEADVGDKEAIHRIALQAAELLGPVDVLVNNASVLGSVPLEPLLDTECEDLERALAVNLVGPFRLAKALLGPMILRGRGVVVNLSSDAAVSAYPTWGAYSATKAALDHLTRIWGAELEAIPEPRRPRIFSVDPGEMNTRMHAEAIPDADPAALADPAEIARRIASMIARASEIPLGARLLAADWRRS